MNSKTSKQPILSPDFVFKEHGTADVFTSKWSLRYLGMALVLFITSITPSLGQVSPPSWEQLIPEKQIIEWCRHMHAHPKLSFQEYETSKYVEEILKTFDHIEVIRPPRPTYWES